jgi:four helix bundle protein
MNEMESETCQETTTSSGFEVSEFRKLYVWEESKDLAVEVFRTTQNEPFSGDPRFQDLMRKAAVAITSFIAEGGESRVPEDEVSFLYKARQALMELRTQMEIANELHYLEEPAMTSMSARCQKIGKMLNGLIQSGIEAS